MIELKLVTTDDTVFYYKNNASYSCSLKQRIEKVALQIINELLEVGISPQDGDFVDISEKDDKGKLVKVSFLIANRRYQRLKEQRVINFDLYEI